MEEDIQNHCPNSPQLADVIRDNINYQLDQSIKRTLLKESLLKVSLDKDFQDLFHLHPNPALQTTHSKPTFTHVSTQIREACQWLEETDEFAGLAYLPFHSLPRLVNLIHQKIQGTAIILTPYPVHWIRSMEDLCRLANLKWGVLFANQQGEDKVRVLELNELKKLKVLFITPALLHCEEYHSFECDLLMIPDMQLYQNHKALISKAIDRCNPNRVLGLYHTLMSSRFSSVVEQLKMKMINKSKSLGHNMIVLKTTAEEKFKAMQTYLGRNQYKRILIIVNKRQQAINLNKRLLLQSKTSLNLFDYMGTSEMRSLNSEEMLNTLQRECEQQKMSELVRRVNNCEVTISLSMDYLKYCHFDLAIYYGFMDVPQFVESCFTTKDKLLLFSENDYHNYRNHITSELTTMSQLQKTVMLTVEKPPKPQENNKKRSYSDYVDDRLLHPYTLSKELAQKNEEKVIRVHSFCKKHELLPKLFNKIIKTLEATLTVSINYRTVSEVEIDMDSISRLKKQFPMIEQIRRRVNLLNTSTEMERTVRGVLDQLERQGIRYKMTEEVIQFKILKDYQEIQWESLLEMVNGPIMSEAYQVDASFDTFKECAYSSIELTRRQKALQKKDVLLGFKRNPEKEQLGTSSYHKSNLLTSEIEEWIRNSEEMTLNQHEMVMLLQGVEKGRIFRCKDDPIFGRYRSLRYEQLMEAVIRIFGNKKVKME